MPSLEITIRIFQLSLMKCKVLYDEGLYGKGKEGRKEKLARKYPINRN